MNRVIGAPPFQFLKRFAEVVEKPAVDEFHLTSCTHSADKAGNGVDEETKTLFVRSELIVCALAVLKIGVRSVPSDNPSRVVAQRTAAEQKPPKFAVAATKPTLSLERS